MLSDRAQGPDAREIALRVLMAVILAPLGVWAVIEGGIVLKLATAAVGVLAAFEWTRMITRDSPDRRALLFVVAAIGTAVGVWVTRYGFGAVIVTSLVCAAISFIVAKLGSVPPRAASFGAIYTSLPFGAFVWIRDAAPDAEVLSLGLLAIVWTTDIAAYFAGRGFGGPLLSPLDSPNKTWTGAIGALICTCLTGAAIARAMQAPVELWIIASALLSIVAQAGDLLESRFKRQFRVKDTSGLIPGHGGVLDRIDALMAAAVFAALILWLIPGLGAALTQGVRA